MFSTVRVENLKIKQERRITKKKVKSKSNKPEALDSETVLHIEMPAELPICKTEEKQPICIEELSERYPVLKDHALVEKILNVPLNNNQKGRIRQVLKDQLKDAADSILPDIIYGKIVSIVKGSVDLTQPQLRKVRILYNMLRTAAQTEKDEEKKKKKKNKKKKKKVKASTENTPAKDKLETVQETTEQKVQKKPKRIKRYVVFVGNLPPRIDMRSIKMHFKEVVDDIVSVRIPKLEEDRKSSIAYVELRNELSYQRALSKHHSMMGPKRINVLYTTQKNSKLSTTAAKSKSAKLMALMKSGKFVGSMPTYRKRSHRRAKAKQAKAKADKQ